MRGKVMVLAALAATAAAGSAGAQQRVDERRATGPTGVVEVHNVAGTVRVVGWSRNEVQVTGELGRGTDRLDFGTEGDRVVVRVVLPRRSNSRGSDIEVRVPERKQVNVNTVSADIEVRGVAGRVEARAVSGGVRVQGRPRDVFAQSRSGAVDVNVQSERVHAESVSGEVSVAGAVRGDVEASAVSGGVTVSATSGEVRVASVSGEVEVASMRGRAEVTSVSGGIRLTGRQLSGSFQSVSGDIQISGDLARDGSTSINAHSGEVELRLPARTSASVDVNTFSGGISNEIPGSRVTRQSRREYRATLGSGGGARVSIRTFSGDVSLVPQ